MANIKNYGIAGVGSNVQFGKKGGHLVYDAGSTSFTFGDEEGLAIVLTGLASPTNGGDAVNKNYVDSVAQGLDFKDSVRFASVGPIDLATGGLIAVDGLALVEADDRVLVKNQALNTENGIYVVDAAGVWTRATDADGDGEISGGSYVFVEEGDANGSTSFVQTIPGDIEIGTDPQTWAIFARAGEILPGAGLILEGETLNLDLDTLPTNTTPGNAFVVLGSDEKASFSVLMNNNTGLFVQSFGPAGNVRTGPVVPAAGDYDAVMVGFDPTASALVATDVQGAIDALDFLVDGLGTQVGNNTGDIADLDTRVTANADAIVLLQTADGVLQDNIDAVNGRVNDLTALDIEYDDSGTQFPAANVQEAIVALNLKVDTGLGSVAADQVSYVNTTSLLAATNVQAAIDEVEDRVDDVEAANALQDTAITDLSTRMGTAESDITTIEGVNDDQNAAIANLITVDTGLSNRLDALENADTNVSEELATLAGFAVHDGTGTSVVYTPAELVDDAAGTPADLIVNLDYSSLALLGTEFVGDERVAVSSADGLVVSHVTTQDLKDFMVGDLAQNAISAFDSSVTVTDADDTNTVPGSIDFVVDGADVASASATSFDVSVGFTGIDGEFTGTVTSPEFVGHLTGDVTGNVTGTLTGNVSGSIAGGTVSGSTGNFTGGVVAASFSGPLTGNVTGDVTGNADTATEWAGPMTLFVTDTSAVPNALGNIAFDGSEGVTGVTLALNLDTVTGDFITVDEANTAYVNADGDITMTGDYLITGGGVSADMFTATGAVIAASVDAVMVDAGDLNFATNTVTSSSGVVLATAPGSVVTVSSATYDTDIVTNGGTSLVTKSFMDAAIADAVTTGSTGGVYTQKALITLVDGTHPIGAALPANSTVMSVRVNIIGMEALATLAVGTYMSVDENDPSEPGVYISECMAAGSGVINAVVAGAPAGVGTAEVMIQYRVA